MRFKQWIEADVFYKVRLSDYGSKKHQARDKGNIIDALSEDPLINIIIGMLGKLGIKSRPSDLEAFADNHGGILGHVIKSINHDGVNLHIITNRGQSKEKCDKMKSPLWKALIGGENVYL